MKTILIERKFTADQRKAAAKSGAAMSDGSYPIETRGDLENAIRAIGRAKNSSAVKAHIRTRAKALKATDLLPDDWEKESYTDVPEKIHSLLYEADGLTQRSSFDAIQCRVMGAIAANIKAAIDMDCDGDGPEDAGRCDCGCVCGNRYGCSCCANCECQPPKYAWCVDIYPSSVVYQMDGRLFQCDYEDDGEKVTLGEPFEVERSYTPAPVGVTEDEEEESLRESAAHTAGAKTLKGHFVKSGTGIYQVNSVEKDGTATLHGPIGKGGKKTVSHKSLVEDHMDLGPADQLSMVYAAESARDDIHSGNGQKSFITSTAPMQEAAYDSAKGLLTLTIIKPGFNKSGERYYPADVLKRDHKIFESNKMFMDHQTEREAKERPEGSISNWGATLKKVWAESDGTIKGQAAVIDPSLKAKLEELNKQNLLSDMGVSIRALGESAPGEIAGKKTNIVESLLRSRSVDFVTHAGAGGQVEMMESARFEEDSDLDLVSESELRRRRPDLVQLIESNAKEQQMNEKDIQAMKDRLAVLEKENAKLQESAAVVSQKKLELLENENKELVKENEQLKTGQQKRDAAATLVNMLKESKLPEAAQKRIQERFKEATSTDDMEEAIKEERDYIKTIGGRSEVRNLGESHSATERGTDEPKKKMDKSFARFAPKTASA